MLPRQVLTHLNDAQRAACRPEPVRIGRCSQPAFSTAGQQDRPSLTTVLPGARSRLAILSTSLLRQPLTTLSRSRRGLRSGGGPTATTGRRPAAPRRRARGGGLARARGRRLAGGAPAALAARPLAAEVGVVDLDPP